MRLAALLCLTILCHIAAEAQAGAPKISTDTLNILFRSDSVRIDFNFANNARVWQNFEDVFLRDYSHYNPANLRLDIYSGASPEGNRAHNEWLGEHRGQAVAQLVRQRLGGRVGNIVVHNEGPRWQALYDNIAASNELWRDEVLAILDKPAGTNPRVLDPREIELRRLYRGRLWPKLQPYLAPLRSGASAVLSWQPARDTVVVMAPAPLPARRDTIVIREVHRDTVWVISTAPPPMIMADYKQRRADSLKAVRDSIYQSRLGYPAWAVKTNLLMWGIVAPNVQVEIPLGRTNRWSLELECFSPWFTWSHNAHAHQCLNGGIEVRYWLGHRERYRWLQGWHIGLAGAVGYYDIEWKKHDGYQGEYVNTYLNLGYQHRWGRHWGLDFGIGAGGFFTKYRHYNGGSVYPDNHLEEWDEHLIYRNKGNFTWIGPCHANLSLVYFFNGKRKITRQ